MKRRRLLRWSLIIVALAAFAIWLEPTRVVWGWLRGEEFYDGRPASWWAAELTCYGFVFVRTHEGRKIFTPTSRDAPADEHVAFVRNGYEMEFWRNPNWIARKWHDISKGGPITLEGYAPAPTLLEGEPGAEPVLRALAEQDAPELRAVVLYGLMNIAKRQLDAAAP